MPLGYSLLQILRLDILTIATSELEVLVFNSDASLRMIKGLPDVAIKACMEGDQLLIRCLDNTLIKLNVQTGVVNSTEFLATSAHPGEPASSTSGGL